MLNDEDLHVYSLYRSKHNKESLDTLRYGMTLDEFLIHRDYILQTEDLELAYHKDEEARIAKERQRGK